MMHKYMLFHQLHINLFIHSYYLLLLYPKITKDLVINFEPFFDKNKTFLYHLKLLIGIMNK